MPLEDFQLLATAEQIAGRERRERLSQLAKVRLAPPRQLNRSALSSV